MHARSRLWALLLAVSVATLVLLPHQAGADHCQQQPGMRGDWCHQTPPPDPTPAPTPQPTPQPTAAPTAQPTAAPTAPPPDPAPPQATPAPQPQSPATRATPRPTPRTQVQGVQATPDPANPDDQLDGDLDAVDPFGLDDLDNPDVMPEIVVRTPLPEPTPMVELAADHTPNESGGAGAGFVWFIVGLLIGGVAGRASWGLSNRRRRNQQIFG